MLAVEDEQAIATIEGLAEIARGQFLAVLEGTEWDVIATLRKALVDGRVDGEEYWHPKDRCGCVLGWIAFAEGHRSPASVAINRPGATTFALEEWAHPIRPDDVPDHTQGEDTGPFRAAVLVSWIDGRLAGQVVV